MGIFDSSFLSRWMGLTGIRCVRGNGRLILNVLKMTMVWKNWIEIMIGDERVL